MLDKLIAIRSLLSDGLQNDLVREAIEKLDKLIEDIQK